MKKTAQKLILISFVLALISAAIVFLYLESLKKPAPVIEKTTVLVAARTIPARTLIEKDMISQIEVTEDTIFDSCIKNPDEIVGRFAKTTIYQNEGFNKDKLLDTNEDELSLKIKSNHRAMSLNVSGDQGVSNLLKPGDFVDVIVFIPYDKNETGLDEARIILQNIEVLAVNKQINRPDAASEKTDEEEEAVTNFLVTLSIPVSEAERLVLAENIGVIKLNMRPFKEESTFTTKGTTVPDLRSDEIPDEGAAMPAAEGGEPGTGYILYTVQRGDTLQKLAEKFYGDKSKYGIIMNANNIKNKDLILTVEVLKIPLLPDQEVNQ